jgi:plastocyanin
MPRAHRTLAATLATGALALLAAGGAAANAPKQLDGAVGPGFTIRLTMAGKPVTKLEAGIAYRFVVKDKASAHDFHLTGPGLSKVITGVPFTGSTSVVLRLKEGTYRYACDPHASSMHGSFTVA